MKGLSCLLNFKENLCKNADYYEELAEKISDETPGSPDHGSCTLEHATFSGDHRGIVSKVCEGYQFTAVFSGCLFEYDTLRTLLSSFGYHFLSENHGELALISYIHFGEKCSEKLSGDFTLIIYDSMRRCIFAFSKGCAMPIYYSKRGDFYVLSTSLNGIFEFPHTKRKIGKASVLELLSVQNRVPSQIFDGVSVLSERNSLKISKNGITKTLFFTQNEKVNPYENVITPSFQVDDQLDEQKIFNALSISVSALGFPFLSEFDFILPLTKCQGGCTNSPYFFAESDRHFPYKSYLKTLLENDAFFMPIAKNLVDFKQKSDLFPHYAPIICNFLSEKEYTRFININPSDFSLPLYSQKLKTLLRRILLAIISKDNAPILAFYKRSSLLRLCEGRFSFSANEEEAELTAFLIKLNLWFEIFSPVII